MSGGEKSRVGGSPYAGKESKELGNITLETIRDEEDEEWRDREKCQTDYEEK